MDLFSFLGLPRAPVLWKIPRIKAMSTKSFLRELSKCSSRELSASPFLDGTKSIPSSDVVPTEDTYPASALDLYSILDLTYLMTYLRLRFVSFYFFYTWPYLSNYPFETHLLLFMLPEVENPVQFGMLGAKGRNPLVGKEGCWPKGKGQTLLKTAPSTRSLAP